MKVISSKPGSSRERVDADIDLLPIANWRIGWKQAGNGRFRADGRHLVLSSRFGAERSSELWLTEVEAIAIAQAVSEHLFSDAARRISEAPKVAPEALSSHLGGGDHG